MFDNGLFQIIGLLLAIGLAFIPAKIASSKGYSFIGFYVFGFFLFLIALVVAAVIKPKGTTVTA